MRRFLESQKSIPFLFAVVTVAAYGLLLPLTGFYWDDLPFAWIAKFLGPAEFVPAFWRLRPFLGPIFFVTTSLIPPEPSYWQVFALVVRFLSGLSAWYALNQIFPRFQRQTLIASLLFLVYPGYSQHWVALTHINQEWIPLVFYLLSFGFTARALRNKNSLISNTVYALLLLVLGLFPTEYFIGLEPLRFLFMWVILSEEVSSFRSRLIQTLKRWLPYLLIWLGNAAWLAYFYTSGIYISYDVEVTREPLSILQVLPTIGDVIWKAGFYVWVQVFALTAKAIAAPTSILTLILLVVSFASLLFYLVRLNAPAGDAKTFAVSALWIGLAGILLGRIPSFAAGLPLTLQSSNDRFMISIMLGGALFAVGAVEFLVRDSRFRIAVFAFLIAAGIGQQFFNANIFRRDWERQRDVYWQFAWRMPAIQPGTLLLTSYVPIDYETDNSLTAPINWMYAPNFRGGSLPFMLLYMDVRLGGPTLPSLDPDVRVRYSYRTVTFDGSTSQAIVFYFPQRGCLRVLDPTLEDADVHEITSRDLADAMPLSKLSLILEEGNATPPFFPEPERGWCYYYAKAELARQFDNWDEIVILHKEVTSNGYEPADPYEWSPFIEAHAMNANYDEAERLSEMAVAGGWQTRVAVCNVWKRVQAQVRARSGDASIIEETLSALQCAR